MAYVKERNGKHIFIDKDGNALEVWKNMGYKQKEILKNLLDWGWWCADDHVKLPCQDRFICHIEYRLARLIKNGYVIRQGNCYYIVIQYREHNTSLNKY
mgnify:CR=1 FL=1